MSEKGKNKVRLSNPGEVQRFLARVANEVYQHKIDVERARCLCYLSKTILEAISANDLEERLTKLEDSINDKAM